MEGSISNIFTTNQKVEELDDILVNKDLKNMLITIPPISVNCESNSGVILEPFVRKANPTFSRNINRKTIPVKTIGKIRSTFEKDQSASLVETLSKNESFLIKCRKKPFRETNSLEIKTIIENKTPLTRASLKGLAKLNFQSFKYSQQYIIVNEKKFLLAGSIGGNCDEIIFKPIYVSSNKKYIDGSKPNLKTVLSTSKNKSNLTRRKGLLTSLNVTFKPGPLSLKPTFQNSRNNILGNIELMKLPAVGLQVFPHVGTRLELAVCHRLQSVRDTEGHIDEDWAKFASSVINHSSVPKQENPSYTFKLNYQNNQSRILMQKDPEMKEKFKFTCTGSSTQIEIPDLETELPYLDNYFSSNDIEDSVKPVLTDLLKTVAISEIQNRIWKFDPRDKLEEATSPKKIKKSAKPAKRKFTELKRLDVTVIDVHDTSDDSPCLLEHCKLGCVCASLNTQFLLKNHCGQPECMFKCTCDCNFEISRKCKDMNSEISNSTVLNFQHQFNRHLAKEEKKFKRTVIHSKDQTIVMGACRRGLRVPKKYEDFITSDLDATFHHENFLCDSTSLAMVNLVRLPDITNLKVWCMIHQLYNCFCNGIFTEGTKYKFSYSDYRKLEKPPNIPCTKISESHSTNLNLKPEKLLIVSTEKSLEPPEILLKQKGNTSDNVECARVVCFKKSKKQNEMKKYKIRNCGLRKFEAEHPENLVTLINLINKCCEDNIGGTSILKDNNPTDITERNKINKEIKLLNSIKIFPPLQSDIKSNKIKKNFISEQIIIIKKTNANIDQIFLEVKRIITEVGCPEILKLENVGPPECSKIKLYPRGFLMYYLNTKQLYLWVTKSMPLKLFVTLTIAFSGPFICENLNEDNLHLLEYDDVLNQIVFNGDDVTHSDIILLGKPFAWEAVGIINKNKDKESTEILNVDDIPAIQNQDEKPSEVKSFSLEESSSSSSSKKASDTNDLIDAELKSKSFYLLPEIQTIDTNYVIRPQNNICIPIPNVANCRWLWVNLGDDFYELQVQSKKFSISRDEVFEVIETAQLQNKTCRRPAVPYRQKLPLSVFSLYGVAEISNHVFLGPYNLTEEHGLTILKNVSVNIPTRFTWINPTNQSIEENCLSNSNNASDKNIENHPKPKPIISKICGPPRVPNVTVVKKKRSEMTQLHGKVISLLTKDKMKSASVVFPVKIAKICSNSLLKPINQTNQIFQLSKIVEKIQPNCTQSSTSNTENVIIEIDNVLTKDKVDNLINKKQSSIDDSRSESIPSTYKNNDEIQNGDNSGDDSDVIILPSHNPVVEISDSEDDIPNVKSSVWFVCINIPSIGYIEGTMYENHSVSIKMANSGVIDKVNPKLAMLKINGLLRKCIGFASDDIICKWKIVFTLKELENLKPFDEKHLNQNYVITKNGIIKKKKMF